MATPEKDILAPRRGTAAEGVIRATLRRVGRNRSKRLLVVPLHNFTIVAKRPGETA
jgi:hypothetical protein